MKILIVDHDESDRLFYADEFSEEGYDVMTAEDGSQILDVIRENFPDLVLLEARLDDYDGFELLHDFRNTYYNLPVILYSSYPTLRYDPRSIAADYYVDKKPDIRELKNKIRMAIETGFPP